MWAQDILFRILADGLKLQGYLTQQISLGIISHSCMAKSKLQMNRRHRGMAEQRHFLGDAKEPSPPKVCRIPHLLQTGLEVKHSGRQGCLTLSVS